MAWRGRETATTALKNAANAATWNSYGYYVGFGGIDGSMAAGDYVLGLEPTNCCIMGRRDERENGTLKVLKAFASVSNTVKLAFEEA